MPLVPGRITSVDSNWLDVGHPGSPVFIAKNHGGRASIIDERTGERVVKAFKKGGVLGAIGGVVRFAENDIVKALENLL